MSSDSFVFRRKNRIRRRSEILHLQETGTKVYSRDFILILASRDEQWSRLAVTVSKRVDKRAARRNRVKRRLKELFRLNQTRLSGCFDILIIARKNAAEINFAEMKRQVIGALHHNGYIK